MSTWIRRSFTGAGLTQSPPGPYFEALRASLSGTVVLCVDVSGSMTVTKAALTITASSAAVGFGDYIPAVTPVFSGFVNGDDQFDLITQPTCSTTATSTSPAGDYPTICSGAAANNYTINYQPGTLSIVKAILTVTASSVTGTFVAPCATGTSTGF